MLGRRFWFATAVFFGMLVLTVLFVAQGLSRLYGPPVVGQAGQTEASETQVYAATPTPTADLGARPIEYEGEATLLAFEAWPDGYDASDYTARLLRVETLDELLSIEDLSQPAYAPVWIVALLADGGLHGEVFGAFGLPPLTGYPSPDATVPGAFWMWMADTGEQVGFGGLNVATYDAIVAETSLPTSIIGTSPTPSATPTPLPSSTPDLSQPPYGMEGEDGSFDLAEMYRRHEIAALYEFLTDVRVEGGTLVIESTYDGSSTICCIEDLVHVCEDALRWLEEDVSEYAVLIDSVAMVDEAGHAHVSSVDLGACQIR